MEILAISGSLRAKSSNTNLLRALASLAPEGVGIHLYEGLGDLPHFNPDLEDTPPAAVQDLRQRVLEADGVVICSPEYAHGVPGTLKNALDWLVSSGETVYKPFSVLNASSRSTHANESLLETLRMMTATLVPGACVVVPLTPATRETAAILADKELVGILNDALNALIQAIEAQPSDRL